MKPLLAALLAWGAAHGAAAAQHPVGEGVYTAAYTRCMDSASSTAAQIGCISEELKIQDGRLNAVYRQAMQGLTAAQRAKLQAAQRAWITFRDADCRSLEDPAWGSLSRVAANQCVLERTMQRAQDLSVYPFGEDRD